MNCRSLLRLLILFLHPLLITALSQSTQNPITSSPSERFLTLQTACHSRIAQFHTNQAMHLRAIGTKLSLVFDALSLADADLDAYKTLLVQAGRQDGKAAMKFLDDAARMLVGMPNETKELQRLGEEIKELFVVQIKETRDMERFIREKEREVEELRDEIQKEIEKVGVENAPRTGSSRMRQRRMVDVTV